jgi:hypothetical protein
MARAGRGKQEYLLPVGLPKAVLRRILLINCLNVEKDKIYLYKVHIAVYSGIQYGFSLIFR